MALKDEFIQKALRRTKITPQKNSDSKYTHFKIYEIPSIESPITQETKEDTNRTQTEHKPNTNQTQTRYKSDTESDTNKIQIGHKKSAIFINRTQNEHETGHTKEHKQDTNRIQIESSYINSVDAFSFSSFIGLQRDILFLFYHDCKNRRSKETQELSLQHISDSLKIRLGSVKTSIRRLEEKMAIKRIKFKIGRSGWSSYELNEHIYREIMQSELTEKLSTNRTQTGHKPDTKLNTESDTNGSSSSLKDLKTTTTEELGNAENIDWIKEIDLDPLNPIGFSIHHLKQIASQNKLSPDIIQQSIYAFAFDLNENQKAKTLKGEPLNFFMGILRKGMPYVPPANYESPEDRTMRLFLERKKETDRKRLELEEEAVKMACEEWFNSMSETEREALIPLDKRNFVGSAHRIAWFRTYFRENLWEARRAEFLGIKN